MRQFRKYFPKSSTARWEPWYCNPHLDDEKVKVWKVKGTRHWEAGGYRKWEKKDA